MKIVLAALIGTMLVPGVLYAHETGKSFEKEVAPYLVDIGYDSDPVAGSATNFDFELSRNHEDVPFSDVWVRIEDAAGAAVLATGVHPGAYGGARLLYRFAEPGAYHLMVRYETGTTTLAEADFPLLVAPGSGHPAAHSFSYIWLLLAGVPVLAILLLLARRKES